MHVEMTDLTQELLSTHSFAAPTGEPMCDSSDDEDFKVEDDTAPPTTAITTTTTTTTTSSSSNAPPRAPSPSPSSWTDRLEDPVVPDANINSLRTDSPAVRWIGGCNAHIHTLV